MQSAFAKGAVEQLASAERQQTNTLKNLPKSPRSLASEDQKRLHETLNIVLGQYKAISARSTEWKNDIATLLQALERNC